MDRTGAIICALASSLALAAGCVPPTDEVSELTLSIADQLEPVTTLPANLDPTCEGGFARIYDECSDQREILREGIATANAEGKIPLVSFGAEFCTWCHVFDKFINGEVGAFQYNNGMFPRTYEETPYQSMIEEAIQLNRFAAANFVVIHIESDYAPYSFEVLEATDAVDHYEYELPFIYSLDANGDFAAMFDHYRAEVTEGENPGQYSGYDRTNLFRELERMADAARPSKYR